MIVKGIVRRLARLGSSPDENNGTLTIGVYRRQLAQVTKEVTEKNIEPTQQF
jgi:hypothetical protein